MDKEKKVKKIRRRPGIQTKLTAFVALFTVLLLVVIWLLFVVMLDGFYTETKHKELLSSAQLIEQSVDSDTQTLEEAIGKVFDSTGASVAVFKIDAEGNLEEYSCRTAYKSVLNNRIAVLYLLSETQESGGDATFTFKNSDLMVSDGPRPPDASKDDTEYMLYSKLTEGADGTSLSVMLCVALTPVDATTSTIQNLLITVSVVFIVLALMLSYILASDISRPLEKLTNSAKNVGTDKYAPVSGSLSCREIEELNDTLSHASSELFKVEELRRELIANVSHDLRTPLTMICGYGEMMRDIPGENTPENVQVIIDEAEHLRRLVNDMLSLSVLQSGMNRLDATDFCVTQTLRDIISRYGAMKAAEGYTLKLTADCDVNVCADELKISQVFYNLINNAIAYTGEDKTVTVKQSVSERDGESFVRFDIIDTGVGITEENLPYVWDRYYKENGTHKRAAVGTGLGLSIVRSVVELHRGNYGVQSTPGQGSDFWFELKAK